MDTRKRAAIKYAYDKTQGAKKYLPYVICFLILVLIIPLYVEVYKPTKTSETLFLATEEQQMALEVSTVNFVDLVTYYPKVDGNISGTFEVTTTIPESLTFRVISKDGSNVTTSIEASDSKGIPTKIKFSNNQGGLLTVQYTNSSSDNFITRIDVIID